MSLDEWSKKGSVDVCCGADVNDQDRVVWGSANEATVILGVQNCLPESSKVAVPGNGKQAARIQSRYINSLLVKKFAAGTLFTGQMDKINIMKGNATLKWGIPFTLRPKSLQGYACYQPVAITLIVLSAAAVWGISRLLLKTDDPQPVSDALAMTVAVGAQFLLTFAFIEQWFMWIVVNGANLVMWAIAATRGVQFAPIMVVQYVFYMMNSIYGIVWWSKMSKKA